MRAALVVLAFAIAVGQPPEYRPIPFPPVDAARKDNDLAAFREHVRAIAKRRSIADLVTVTSKTVEDQGEPLASRLRRDFLEIGAPHWQRLLGALRLGGAHTVTRGAVAGRAEFCAPYVYAAFPGTLPPWIGGESLPWVVTAPNAPVHEKPNVTSTVIGRVGPAIVEYFDEVPSHARTPPDSGWVLIALTASARGFVSREVARSPSDWHVCFAKENDDWRVSAFNDDPVPLGDGGPQKIGS